MRLIAPLRRHSIAFLALMVALGGGAYAQIRIGTADLRNNAVGRRRSRRTPCAGNTSRPGRCARRR
jgi:hypothetical protein